MNDSPTTICYDLYKLTKHKETKDHTKASVGLSEGRSSLKSRNIDATARIEKFKFKSNQI